MVLSDLSLSENNRPDDIKAVLASKLGEVLPAGSYRVIVRSFSGDVRTRSTNKASFQAMILLEPSARQVALERKHEIEAMGFRVTASGDIHAN